MKPSSPFKIIQSAFAVYARYPQTLVPLLFSWAAYAPVTLYFYFVFDWKALSFFENVAVCFGIIFFFSLSVCLSGCWLLELISQIESGQKPNLVKSCSDTLRKHSRRVLPIAFIWASLHLVLCILDAMTKEKNKSNESRKLDMESAAKVLAGARSGPFSFLGMSFSILKSLLRMVTFLSLPALCWQGRGPMDAIKQAFKVVKRHQETFFMGFALTGAVSFLVFLPIILPIFMHGEKMIQLPDEAWPVFIFYASFAWSFSIYIEQMFTAELYLWHLTWDKAVQQAKSEGRALKLSNPVFSMTETIFSHSEKTSPSLWTNPLITTGKPTTSSI